MIQAKLKKIFPLVNALKKAQEEADKFKDYPDGGTVNSDTVTITLKQWYESDVFIVSEQSGIKIGRKLGSSLWKNSRRVNFRTDGQGARNTKQMEVACKVLEEAGYDATMFYRMD